MTFNLINTGIDAGDSIQLAVKIAYPKEEISKRNKVHTKNNSNLVLL